MVSFVTSSINKSKFSNLALAKRNTRKQALKHFLTNAAKLTADAALKANGSNIPYNAIELKFELGKGRSNSDGTSGKPPLGKKSKKKFYSDDDSSESYRPYDKRAASVSSFTSGIDSKSLYMQHIRPGDSSQSPIFIQCGSMFSKRSIETSNSKVLNYLETHFNNIYNEICLRKGPNIGRTFDKDDYFSYLLDVKCALEAVFSLRSILTYQESNPEYQNYGIQKIQERFTPNIRGYLTDLEASLEVCYFPPNLLKFLKYIYSNFRSSDCENSAIIRLSYERLLYVPSSDICLEGSMESDILKQLKDNLTKPKTDWHGNAIKSDVSENKRLKIGGLLASTFPDRMIDRSDFNVNGKAVYDSSFLNFWHNSAITFVDPYSSTPSNEVTCTREVQEPGEYILYESVCSKEQMDGYVLGLQSLNYKGVIGPGIWNPLTDFNSIFDENNHSNLMRMNDTILVSNMPAELASQSGVQYVPVLDNNDITIRRYPNFGTILLEGLCIYTAEEYSVRLLSYLL